MAPAAPLAALTLVALLAPGLGVALPGCDYPAHLWCSSWEIAVACQVRAAGARAGLGTHLFVLAAHAGQSHLARGRDGAGHLPGEESWDVRGWCWALLRRRTRGRCRR